jgi:hypothetical protein
MADDDLSICNQALTQLGENPINSITAPATDIERTCALTWPNLRDTILGLHDWTFGSKELQLGIDADEPPLYGYKYAYALPAGMLSGPTTVYSAATMTKPDTNYRNSGTHIHCDFAQCWIEFEGSAAISTWPPYMVFFAVTALAAALAKPICDNDALADSKRIEAWGPANLDGNGGLFLKAKNANDKTKPIKSLFRNSDPLTQTRY